MKMLEKLQKRLQEGKKDNKGFSLVELIIVIAIMAILVGIVGMNVIPQIENSRKATDEQVLSALCTEAMEAYTQQAYGVGVYTITFNVGADGLLTLASVEKGTGGTDADATKIKNMMSELGNTTRKLKSAAGKELGTGGITITLTDVLKNADGSVKNDTDGEPVAPVTLKAGTKFQWIRVR